MLRASILATTLCVLPTVSLAQAQNEIARAMHDLGVDTALIFPNAPADEMPLWSPDSSQVALNIMGTWLGFDLSGLTLGGATWHEQDIGIISGIDNPNPFALDPATIAAWQQSMRYALRELETENGIFALRPGKHGSLSTEFATTNADGTETVHWATGGENCHSLSLSPDQQVLLFICEINGVFAWLTD